MYAEFGGARAFRLGSGGDPVRRCRRISAIMLLQEAVAGAGADSLEPAHCTGVTCKQERICKQASMPMHFFFHRMEPVIQGSSMILILYI